MRNPIRSIRFDASAQPDAGARTTTAEWYADPKQRFKSGFWAAQTGRAEIAYEVDELCVLIEGLVRLTDETGHVETYRAGDTFLIPNGFKGVWETVEPVRKFYAVYVPSKA
ncbi:MAG TPA: cupin domain-containing protein [Stellaceae bacterium]|nr:cupin domain-containing protein [Stellaceae bacterium]